MTTALVGGLLIGIGWLHGLRVIASPEDPPARQFIARAAFLLYCAAGVCCLLPLAGAQILGLCVAIFGPILGFTAVIVTGNRPDNIQVFVGWLQALTLVLAATALAHILEVF